MLKRAGAWIATLTLWSALLAAQPQPSHSGATPTGRKAEYSAYEKATIRLVLKQHEGRVEPNPEGKVIESIEVVPLDVIEPRDPAPEFLNWLHATTRPAVVRREMLLRPGQRYNNRLIAETERNLRARRQLSLVLIVPLQGSQSDHVRLLVITKDVWSLRLNSDFRFTNEGLEFLLLQPAEENLLGAHHRLATQYVLQPDTLSFGAQFSNPRLAGQRLQLGVAANIIFNRETGDQEGSFGGLSFARPLFSTRTRWGWGTALSWRTEIARRTEGLDLVRFDAAVTPSQQDPLYEFDSERLFWQTWVARSFGWRNKLNVRFGLEANRGAFSPTERLASFDPRAVRQFVRSELPVSDTRVGPFVQVTAFRNAFHRVLDLETLGLQEDYQLGHNLFLKLYSGARVAQSTRDVLGVDQGLSYTVPLGNGLARAWGTHRVELAQELDKFDAQVEGGIRAVSPTFGFGRLIYDGGVLHRYRNHLNTRFTLGGDTRLRGYPSTAFVGKDVVASNLEFRTRSLQLWTLLFGAAAFYDVGDAFDGFDDLDPKHAVGFGLRGGFPQMQRSVGRLDVSFPLQSPDRTQNENWPGFAVVVTFGQAFSVPSVNPRSTVIAAPVR